MEHRTGAATLLSLGMLGLVWVAACLLGADPEVLPAPWTVAGVWWDEVLSGKLWFHMQATLGRVAAAFVLAMGLGCALGIALGRSPLLDRWLSPWVAVFLNIPALVVIVLCYLWIGLNEVAAITAVAVNKTAMVTVTMREGMRARDRALDDMARVYRMTAWQRLVHVIWPQLAPYLAGATRNGLAIIWKIVLVVEFLGRSNGVGFQIHLYFSLFDVAHVLAYALSFTALMVAVEFGLLQSWERRTQAWRRAGQAAGT